jgi:hypothetical protein
MIISTFASFDQHEKEKVMKQEIRKSLVVIAALCLVVSAGLLAAEESWESLNQQAKQAKIDETAQESLNEVFKGNKAAKDLYRPSETSSKRAGKLTRRLKPPPAPLEWEARQASSTESPFTRSRTKA